MRFSSQLVHPFRKVLRIQFPLGGNYEEEEIAPVLRQSRLQIGEIPEPVSTLLIAPGHAAERLGDIQGRHVTQEKETVAPPNSKLRCLRVLGKDCFGGLRVLAGPYVRRTSGEAAG